MEEKAPDIGRVGGPIWWHHHGTKIRIAAQGICNDVLLLQGSAAEILIQKHRNRNRWLLTWKIIQGPDSIFSGKISLSDKELLGAFGHHYVTPENSNWLIARYGGTAACHGRFIRYQKWLNIPGPGTGNDGDPNISVEVDEKITKAIIDLVYNIL